jgi:hypothetical protein
LTGFFPRPLESAVGQMSSTTRPTTATAAARTAKRIEDTDDASGRLELKARITLTAMACHDDTATLRP